MGVALACVEARSLPNFVSSTYSPETPRNSTSDESLSRDTNWLVVGGITMRTACGMMIVVIDLPYDMPSERAASICPFGTACRPARSVSAM
nr:hypothetical protein GCM10020093_116440 [Planobispora longispora]